MASAVTIASIAPIDAIPSAPKSNGAKLLKRLIEADEDAFGSLFRDIYDNEAIRVVDVAGVKKVGIWLGTTKENDEMRLDVARAGGTPVPGMPYQPKIYYSQRKMTTNAAAAKVIGSSMDDEVAKWNDPRLSMKHWVTYCRELGFTTAPQVERQYKKFLLRLWRAYLPDEALPVKGSTPKRPSRKSRDQAPAQADRDSEGEDGVDGDLSDEDQSFDKLLATFGMDSVEALWSQFNSKPVDFQAHMRDEVFLSALAEGCVAAMRGYDGKRLTSRELRAAATAAINRDIKVTDTDTYIIYLTRAANGGKGKVEVLYFPSLQEIDGANRKRKKEERKNKQRKEEQALQEHEEEVPVEQTPVSDTVGESVKELLEKDWAMDTDEE